MGITSSKISFKWKKTVTGEFIELWLNKDKSKDIRDCYCNIDNQKVEPIELTTETVILYFMNNIDKKYGREQCVYSSINEFSIHQLTGKMLETGYDCIEINRLTLTVDENLKIIKKLPLKKFVANNVHGQNQKAINSLIINLPNTIEEMDFFSATPFFNGLFLHKLLEMRIKKMLTYDTHWNEDIFDDVYLTTLFKYVCIYIEDYKFDAEMLNHLAKHKELTEYLIDAKVAKEIEVRLVRGLNFYDLLYLYNRMPAISINFLYLQKTSPETKERMIYAFSTNKYLNEFKVSYYDPLLERMHNVPTLKILRLYYFDDSLMFWALRLAKNNPNIEVISVGSPGIKADDAIKYIDLMKTFIGLKTVTMYINGDSSREEFNNLKKYASDASNIFNLYYAYDR